MTTRRLFVVVRADLAPGPQLAQAIHAALCLAANEATYGRDISDGPVAVLHARDETQVRELAARAFDRRVPHALFEEPDMGGAATALAMYGDGAAGLVRALPLAFQGP